MSFRRPIPRGNYRWKRTPKPGNSLRYETILDGAVRVYPDGREVCQDSPRGFAEYKRRLETMLARQDGRCCLCGEKLHRNDATFEHQRRRGMAAGQIIHLTQIDRFGKVCSCRNESIQSQ